MKKEELAKKVKGIGKETFTPNDLKKLFPKDHGLINTYIKRFKNANFITPVTRGVYIITGNTIDTEKVATTLYYPSYISFESALSKYGIINQGLFKITLATTRHSKRMALLGTECEYSKINNDLFFGFNLIGGVYIAEPEKAFLDTLYLVALGKRRANYNEWYTNSLNRKKIAKYVKEFGKATEKLAGEVLK